VRRLVSATAIAIVIAACAPQGPVLAPRTATPTVILVPTELPNGRIEIRVQPTYVLGTPTRIDVSIVATQGTVTGPTEARVTGERRQRGRRAGRGTCAPSRRKRGDRDRGWSRHDIADLGRR
jgi:hypothetical protein